MVRILDEKFWMKIGGTFGCVPPMRLLTSLEQPVKGSLYMMPPIIPMMMMPVIVVLIVTTWVVSILVIATRVIAIRLIAIWV
jgi:hypothetical protein